MKLKFILFASIIMPCFLFANIKILPEYCVDSKDVSLSVFTNEKNDTKVIFNLANSWVFQVPSLKITSALDKLGLKYEDFSGGVIEFKRFCDIEKNMPEVKNALIQEYKKYYKDIKIEDLKIHLKSKIDDNFQSAKFDKIVISEPNLRKNKASFKAIYKFSSNLEKTLFFDYEIKAFVNIFKAKYNLSKGKIISENDIQKLQIKLEQLPSDFLKNKLPLGLVAKQSISKDRILCDYFFKNQALVFKNSFLDAYIQEKGLTLIIQVQAMQDGQKGDIIRVKTKDKKILRARIISHNKVQIQ